MGMPIHLQLVIHQWENGVDNAILTHMATGGLCS